MMTETSDKVQPTYRLYCGTVESQKQFLAFKDRWSPYSYHDLDDALRLALSLEGVECWPQ